jgi:hypothetical protein
MRGSIKKRGNTYTYVVDIGPDPATGKRRPPSAPWRASWCRSGCQP